ncbi:MAG: lysophospholipid acyltransferase family protein [Chthonomonadaceae bacterium]|nr:lysophospholipid acyltransferase family protein [Chthonomonadaceae bacterium]
MKRAWRYIRPIVLSGLVYGLARLLGLTLRFRTEGMEPFKALTCGWIVTGWHGRSLLAVNFFRKRGAYVIISLSRDGEMQNRVFRWFGFKTIRGSTGRGGARAAIESIRVLRKGAGMTISPDGPRGPSGVVQNGVMLMAQKSGAALVPVGFSAHPRWLAPTWDRYLVPWPFAKVLLVFGEPLYVPPEATADEVEVLRLKLEEQMHQLQADADRRLGVQPCEVAGES